jgi:hypothetical protein
MRSPLAIPDRLAPLIVNLPETGMGYWVANVRTRKGETFKRVVIDSGFILSVDRNREIPFDPEDIVAFEVTHDKTAILHE